MEFKKWPKPRGRPFEIGVFVNGAAGYTVAKPGIIKVLVKASGREDQTKLGLSQRMLGFAIERDSNVTLIYMYEGKCENISRQNALLCEFTPQA